MTVTTTDTSSGPYTGTGAVGQSFPVTFHSGGADQIKVWVGGIEVSSSQYVFNRNADGTGTVVATLTGTVNITSAPAFLQPVDFQRYGPYFPDDLNGPLDASVIRDLYLKKQIESIPQIDVQQEADAAAAAAGAAHADRLAAAAAATAAGTSSASAAASEAQAALDAAAAQALSNGYLFDTAAEGVSQGILSLTIGAAGSGGANGTFPLAFSGGGGTLAAGSFTVSGGAVTGVTITKRGKNYTSNPTVSLAASAGLTGATVTAARGNYAVPDGEPYLVIAAGSSFAELYKNVAGSAVDQGLALPSATVLAAMNANIARAEELGVAARTPPAALDKLDLAGPGEFAGERVTVDMHLSIGSAAERASIFQTSGAYGFGTAVGRVQASGAALVATGSVANTGSRAYALIGATPIAFLDIAAEAVLKIEAGAFLNRTLNAADAALCLVAAVTPSATARIYLFKSASLEVSVAPNSTALRIRKTNGTDTADWTVTLGTQLDAYSKAAMIAIEWHGGLPISGRCSVRINQVAMVASFARSAGGYDPTYLLETGDVPQVGDTTPGSPKQIDLIDLALWASPKAEEVARWEARVFDVRAALDPPNTRFLPFKMHGLGMSSQAAWDRDVTRSPAFIGPDPAPTVTTGGVAQLACPASPNVVTAQASLSDADRATSQVGHIESFVPQPDWRDPTNKLKRIALAAAGSCVQDGNGITTDYRTRGQVFYSSTGGPPFAPQAVANNPYTWDSGVVPIGGINNLIAATGTAPYSFQYLRDAETITVRDTLGYHGSAGAQVDIRPYYFAVFATWAGSTQGRVMFTDNPLDARAWYEYEQELNPQGYRLMAGANPNGEIGSAGGDSPWLGRPQSAVMETKGAWIFEGRALALIRTNGPNYSGKAAGAFNPRQPWLVSSGLTGLRGFKIWDHRTAYPVASSPDLASQAYAGDLFELGDGSIGACFSVNFKDLALGTTGVPPTLVLPTGDTTGYASSDCGFYRWPVGSSVHDSDPELVTPKLIDFASQGYKFFHKAFYDWENGKLYACADKHYHGTVKLFGTQDYVKGFFDCLCMDLDLTAARTGAPDRVQDAASTRVVRTSQPFWGGNIQSFRLDRGPAKNFGTIRVRLLYARDYAAGREISPTGFGWTDAVFTDTKELIWAASRSAPNAGSAIPAEYLVAQVETISGTARMEFGGLYADRKPVRTP